MSKRRINKQQSARIQKIQASYRVDVTNDLSNSEEGLVLTRYSRHAEVEAPDGRRVHCSIRPNIESLVAGDRVIWQTQGTDQGVVVSCYPRKTVLERPDKRGTLRAVAANITQLMVVAAVKPELNWPLLDSYLVMAEHLKLKVCILLNKVDLPCDTLKEQFLATYAPLDYPVLFISREQNLGYECLESLLANETSVFVGQSGVGKSSIISQILPEEDNIQTAEISLISELGCHTTSNSRLYHLPHGGDLIDSPGVREFSLWQMPVIDIVYGFREFRELAASCKFRNCNHVDAPGCAIVAASSQDNRFHRRYESLMKLINQRLPASY
ncbi:EngC GTPase [Legionella rubrilucens]|uniref:Small ribosomal subunit biogenesis GTPase RsgA n=1 Tax=Legionella rubrilucens TaxID=458 RepID=A0A0W0XZ65_9GAMM|nr:ribosome small subunit-dependent GTPase A [Legionella rubrilucens]KTD49743.1 EngC GTPase [Legionella rubrilucens]